MLEHGEIQFSWHENLLTTHVTEAFNYEGVVAGFNAVKASVLAKKFTHWKRLEILDNEVLGSQDVLEEVHRNFIWLNTHGCQYTALVVKNHLQQDILKSICNDSIKIFKDLGQAKTWLNEQPLMG